GLEEQALEAGAQRLLASPRFFLGLVAQLDEEPDLLVVDLAVGPQLPSEDLHLLVVDFPVRQRQRDGELLPVGHDASSCWVENDDAKQPRVSASPGLSRGASIAQSRRNRSHKFCVSGG